MLLKDISTQPLFRKSVYMVREDIDSVEQNPS